MVCLYVCVSVDHVREPCKNGWTNQDDVWRTEVGRPKEPWWGSDIPRDRGAILGVIRPVEALGVFAVMYAKQMNRSRCHLGGWLMWVQQSMYCMGVKVGRIHLPPRGWQEGDAAFRQNSLTTCFSCELRYNCSVASVVWNTNVWPRITHSSCRPTIYTGLRSVRSVVERSTLPANRDHKVHVWRRWLVLAAVDHWSTRRLAGCRWSIVLTAADGDKRVLPGRA